MPEDQEGKIPNKEKNLRASEKFNKEFKKHLTRIGWTDPELQKRFVALVNSYILSGDSASSQRVIVNYLDKGLDVLNIELKRIEIRDNDNVVQVNPDDVDDGQQPQVETVSPREFKSILSEGRRKRLSPVNILKEELNEDKKRKQVMRKILSKSEDIEDEDELEEMLEDAVNALLERKVIKEQGDVNSNNFRVFFKNFLNDDKSWSAESTEKFISDILSVVEKGAGNITGQKQAVRELDRLIDKLSKVTEIKSISQTKNSKIAFNELATFASKLRGWSSEFFSEFMDNILKIVGSSNKSQKAQRFVVDKFTSIESSMQDKKEKDKDKSKDKDSNEKKNSKSDKKTKGNKNKEKSSGKKGKEKEANDGKEIKQELDYSYTPREYQSPEEKAHEKLNDRYGVEISKSLKKLEEMRNVDIQKLPEAEEFDKFLTKLEQQYDEDLVESAWTIVIDKPEPFGEYEFSNLILEHLIERDNEIRDVFNVVNEFFKYYKKSGVI